ncbi:uncharacterized protein LTR77_006705 [Saxophila tyrrhenica]|uniref:MOSC domain-containing protein n=1 Tax=Saxophila tyrrhenica TaxID=1690608 RepID=A0AAV9P5P6_9PEZI|nr:hypothetical protein LTR77_006705 [Saxophila tyrrhenica]
MDTAWNSLNTYSAGARGAMNDLKEVLSDPWAAVNNFHQLHWRIHTMMMLIGTAGLAFLIMMFLANWTSVGQKTKEAVKEALPIAKPGSPPIPPPTDIVSLRIYPIKSCRGIELDKTRLRKTGLTLDRNWMFVAQDDTNSNGAPKFLTIRSDPSMTLIDTALVDDPETKQQNLEISIHGTDARVLIPAFPTQEWLSNNTTLKTVEIWEKETDGYVYNDSINAPFSSFFNKPVALVYKGPTHRMVAVNGSKELYGVETAHHFADVMSLQIASQSSIDDLNRRLEAKGADVPKDLTIERFRPNIIVRGRDDKPWEEDTWKRIRITTTLHDEEAMYRIDLDAVARCARCQVPNVDPDTAEKHAKEPWDELMKFRRVDEGGPAKWKPCFGMLCIPRSEGKVAVGATVEVLETTKNHLYNTRKFADFPTQNPGNAIECAISYHEYAALKRRTKDSNASHPAPMQQQ